MFKVEAGVVKDAAIAIIALGIASIQSVGLVNSRRVFGSCHGEYFCERRKRMIGDEAKAGVDEGNTTEKRK